MAIEKYETKFKEFIRMCEDAKAHKIDAVVIDHPEVIGDTYEEIIESLSRLAVAGLALGIARPSTYSEKSE